MNWIKVVRILCYIFYGLLFLSVLTGLIGFVLINYK